MQTLTDKLGDVLETLGKTFLIAGYLPAALLVLAHQVFLFPRWAGEPMTLFQTTAPDGSVVETQWSYLIDQGITLLLLPLLLGLVLVALNTVIIKLYEGAFSWQWRVLLRPWQRRNERRASELFGDLVALKEDYTGVLYDLSDLPPGPDRLRLEQKRISIALEMQRELREIMASSPQSGGLVSHGLLQQLPRRTDKVRPTAVGNAFSVIEEYPYERYGMDGVLFWPRLRPLVEDAQATALTNTKMVLDLLLNLSLLALVFGVETVVIGVQSRLDWTLIGAGLGAWVLAFLCYRGAVSAVHSLGDTIALCFDLYRKKLWDQLGFPSPKSLEEEQAKWLHLGQFLLLGEGFYFPRFPQEQEDKEGKAEREKTKRQPPCRLVYSALGGLAAAVAAGSWFKFRERGNLEA